MRFLLSLAVLVCTSFCTMAQMPMGQMPSKEEIVKMRLDQLTQQLSLTTEQQASVKAIFEEEKMPDFSQGMPDFDAMKKQMDETDAKIEKVLTPEQKTKYDDVKKQRANMMGGGPR